MSDDKSGDVRRLREKLAESEERLLELLNASFEGLLISVDGVIVLANQAAAELTGRSREDLVGKSALDLAPKWADRVIANIRVGLEEPYEIEFEHVDGTVVPVELRGRNIVWDGQPARVTGLRDLRERRSAAQSLRDSEFRFRELADLLPVMVGEADGRGVLQFINRTGVEALGYSSADEIIGRHVVDLLAPEDRERATENLLQRVRGEEIGPQQYLDQRADGSTFPGMHYIGLIERDGQIVGVRTAVIDLTERIAAEEERQRLHAQMLQAQKLESLGILAGGIAHDFNNLLATMLGNAEVALLDLAEDAPARESVHRVKRASLRASELVGKLLAYAGKGPSRIIQVDLNEIATGILDLLDVSLTKTATVAIELDDELPELSGDPTQLRQVVMNLVTNAAEALGPEGGQVRLRTRYLKKPDLEPDELRLGNELIPGPVVVLEVHDTGVGMTPATIPRVFEPFFTTKFAGRGLGLAAVLGIVRAHQGTIAVRSKPGHGSVFRVLLPENIDGGRVAAASGPDVGSGTLPSSDVLLIDDDTMLVDATCALLIRMGVRVRTAVRGSDALAHLDDHRPDLILLDWTLPGMTGRQVLDAIRAVDTETPIVLISGFDRAQVVTNDVEPQIAAFLSKPYSYESLKSTLESVLAASMS